MAMTTCKECAKEISTTAEACPHCGAKRAKPSGCGTIIAGTFLIVALAALASQCSQEPIPEADQSTVPAAATPSKTPQQLDEMLRAAASLPVEGGQRAKALQAVIEAGAGTPQAETARTQFAELVSDAVKANEARGSWDYSSYKDEMSGNTVRSASVTSENVLSFDFPYNGPQSGTLTIRRHPQHGSDVMVSIEKGQILCSSYSSCPIRIAFDDGKPYTIEGNEPADNSTTTVFLPGYKTLVSRIGKAKEMRVSFNVYQQGAPTLIFDVRGLDQAKLK